MSAEGLPEGKVHRVQKDGRGGCPAHAPPLHGAPRQQGEGPGRSRRLCGHQDGPHADLTPQLSPSPGSMAWKHEEELKTHTPVQCIWPRTIPSAKTPSRLTPIRWKCVSKQ